MKTRERLHVKSVHAIPLHAPTAHRATSPARDSLASIIPADDDYVLIHQLDSSLALCAGEVTADYSHHLGRSPIL